MSKRPIVAEDLLRIQIPSDPQLSPDGKACVFAVKKVGSKNNYVSHLWLWREGSLTQLTFGEVMDTQPRWKPDGSGISFVSNRRKPKPQVYFLPLSGGEPHPLTDLPEGSLGKYEWSPDGRHLAFLFREKDSARTKEAKEEREKTGLSDPPLIVETLTWRYDGDGVFGDDRFKLYLLDTVGAAQSTSSDPQSPEPRVARPRVLLDKAKDGAYVFCWAPDSKSLAVAYNTSDRPTMEPWEERLFRLDIATAALTPIEGPPPGEFSALSWSPNGESLACAFADRSEKRFGYKKTDLCMFGTAGSKFANLTRNDDLDLSGFILSDLREAAAEPKLIWHSDSRWLSASIASSGKSRIGQFNIEGSRALLDHDASEVALGSRADETEFTAPSESGFFSGRGQLASIVSSQTSLPEVSWQEVRDISGTFFNQWLIDDIAVCEPEEYSIESEDGTKIQTWVLKPTQNRKPKTENAKLPCAIEVHGGPHAMYSSSFFFEMQLLAANGYVVVFSNPRGSTGYGEDFARCIDGDWGNKDWQDVQAVTKFAKQLPYVDPNRVAIMGGSYGGYMVNWAIGHSDEYKCAITDRCVSNLLSKSGNSDYTFIPNGTWPGCAWENWETLWECSPVKHFANANTPTLVIHSEGDLRCHIEQGEQVYTFLKMKGVPTRLVRYPANTSHGMSRGGPPDMRLHRLKEILRWLEEWL